MPRHRQRQRKGKATHHRTLPVELVRSDSDKREIELSFSSEFAFDRGGDIGIEVLSHDEGAVDLGRLNQAGSVLWSHDEDEVVGTVVRAWLDHKDRKGRAVIRLGTSPLARQIWQDLKAGVERYVSVGYRILKAVRTGTGILAKLWEPLEISLTSIPVDPSVGFGRSITQPPRKGNHIMNTTTDTDELKQIRRERDIRKVAGMLQERGYPASENAIQSAITEGIDSNEFTRRAMSANAGPTFGADQDVLETMQRTEGRTFSVRRAIAGAISRSGVTGYEAEVIQEFQKRSGIRGNEGLLIPYAALNTRSMQAGNFSAGGSFVPTEKGNLIEKLDPVPVLERAGATTIRGLGGPISFPKHTSGATVHWLGENAEVPESTPGTGDVMGTPHRVSAYTELSRELVIGSAIDAEQFVRQELLRRLNIGIDRAGLVGSGVSGEPRGIFKLDTVSSGINTVTFGGAPSWEKITEFESKIQEQDETGSLAWILSATVKGKWKSVTKDSGSGKFLAETAATTNSTANGYPIHVSSQMSGTDFADRAVFGNWAQLMIMLFGGIELLIDQSSALHRRGMLGTTVLAAADIAVRHPESFAVSTDDGNQ